LEYLKAKGIEPNQNGFIRCPWHNDETPSCKVNDDFVYCFSCGESGDIFKVAAALIGVPLDKEHFREIAADVEKTLGLPEWKPPKQRGKSYIKLSKSAIYRSELLKEFAIALDAEDMERAYNRAYLLFALFMLPDGEPEQKKAKPTLKERMSSYAGFERGANE
jgi:DNA primase